MCVVCTCNCVFYIYIRKLHLSNTALVNHIGQSHWSVALVSRIGQSHTPRIT